MEHKAYIIYSDGSVWIGTRHKTSNNQPIRAGFYRTTKGGWVHPYGKALGLSSQIEDKFIIQEHLNKLNKLNKLKKHAIT